MNYELIYRARARFETVSAARLKKYEAEQALSRAEKAFQSDVARLLDKKVDEIEFTNIMCMADGIPYHVYNKASAHGVGHRRCFFCGCDDFDGL